MPEKRVLFLCTHNSARSQMAEGLLRHLGGGSFEVASAGTVETALKPRAVAAMKEIGIDISSHTSKTLERFIGEPWDFVITVCDRANETCPYFPGAAERLHWSFDDPATLEDFRRVRDAIRARIVEFLRTQQQPPYSD